MKHVLLVGILLFSIVAMASKTKKKKQKDDNIIQFLSPTPFSIVLQNGILNFKILLRGDQKISSYQMHLEKGGFSKLNCEEYFCSSINELFTNEKIFCCKKEKLLCFRLKANCNAIPGNYKFHINVTYDTGKTLHSCQHFYVERR